MVTVAGMAKERRVTLIGGPMDGQQITTTTHRMEFPGEGSSEAGVLVLTYDVRSDTEATYSGSRWV